METTSVSEKLKTDFGAEGRPGEKLSCPFCQKNTFSIKADDSIGKCFHPDCGRFITNRADCSRSKFSLVLEEFYKQCKTQMLSTLADPTSMPQARSFFHKRKVSEAVVKQSTIGMVPANSNVRGMVQHILNSDDQKEHADLIKKLESIATKFSGWIAFFYTDQNGVLTSIRLRHPKEKKFASFSINSDRPGVFGLCLYDPSAFEKTEGYHDDLEVVTVPSILGSRLLVTEGEINSLRLQSTLREAGHPFGLVISCGSANNFDYPTINLIDSQPIFFIDYDEAGFATAKSGSNFFDVRYCRADNHGDDLDSFIGNHDCKTAIEMVRQKLGNPEIILKNFSLAIEEVKAIKASCKKSERADRIQSFVKADLLSRAELLHNNERETFLSFGNGHLIVTVHEESHDLRNICHEYGVLPTHQMFKNLVCDLFHTGQKTGRLVTMHNMTYYSKTTNTLYWYNNKDTVYKITDRGIEPKGNGIDGVLFFKNANQQEFYLDLKATYDGSFDRLTANSLNIDERNGLKYHERAFLFKAWSLSILFESIMPTKAIICILGEKGSGKTIALKKIGKILFGSGFEVTSVHHTMDSFDVSVSNNRFLAIDNADSKVAWLEDRLATVATSGALERRALYTTNELVKFKPRCFLGITSRTPKFRRDDVSDRLILIPVHRFSSSFVPEEEILSEIESQREHLLTQIALLAQQILKHIPNYLNVKTMGRMSDFFRFAYAVAGTADGEIQVKDVEAKVMVEQSEFTLEEQPIYSYLLKLFQKNPDLYGTEILNTDLFTKLRELALLENDDVFRTWSNMSFGKSYAKTKSNLKSFFEITERAAGQNYFYIKFVRRQK